MCVCVYIYIQGLVYITYIRYMRASSLSNLQHFVIPKSALHQEKSWVPRLCQMCRHPRASASDIWRTWSHLFGSKVLRTEIAWLDFGVD